MKNETVNVSQWDAAKYYFSVFNKLMPLHWLMPIGIFSAKILTWRIPALIMSQMVSSLQRGEEVNHTKTILIAAAFSLSGEMIVRLVWHFGNRFQADSIKTIYDESMSIVLDKSLGFHGDNFAGSTSNKISKLADGAERFHDLMTGSLPDFASSLAFAIFVLGLEGLPAVGLLLGSFILYIVMIKPLVAVRTKLQNIRTRESSKRTGELIDSISNVLPTKSFVQEKHEEERFAQATKSAADSFNKAYSYSNWKVELPTSGFYLLIAFLPLLYILNTEGAVDGGRIFIVFFALDLLASKIWNITHYWQKTETTLTEAAEGLEVLKYPNEVDDIVGAQDLVVDEGSLEFRDLGFSYDDYEKLFSNLELDVKPGEKVGLVGPSGGGKTTLVKLIMRYMNATDGAIIIDGQDIAKITQKSLRANISFIPQEPALFHRTLRENIAYGNNQATDRQIINAAKKAHAHDFIKNLPEGYDTLVGERGIKLSGGQRQRVAIARSFLKNAPILILDEATSALDSESEVFIQESLIKLMKGKTVISIAHRLSTLQIMDKLLVIENGKITEQGTHRRLLKNKGTYSRLWNHQSGNYME